MATSTVRRGMDRLPPSCVCMAACMGKRNHGGKTTLSTMDLWCWTWTIAAVKATAKTIETSSTMADKELDDVVAGAKFLQSLPNVQKDRLAIMGDDRGAYITYSVIARPNPFKAAVAISGYSDLSQQYEYESEIAPNFMVIQKLMKGSPYTMEERFKDLSPVSFANKINVPVLILHGNNDRLVLPDHAWKMAEALFLHQKEQRHHCSLQPGRGHRSQP